MNEIADANNKMLQEQKRDKEDIAQKQKENKNFVYRYIAYGICSAVQYLFAEGRAEVARKMLDKGMSAELVAEMTGLSLEEVSSLKQ